MWELVDDVGDKKVIGSKWCRKQMDRGTVLNLQLDLSDFLLSPFNWMH